MERMDSSDIVAKGSIRIGSRNNITIDMGIHSLPTHGSTCKDRDLDLGGVVYLMLAGSRVQGSRP